MYNLKKFFRGYTPGSLRRERESRKGGEGEEDGRGGGRKRGKEVGYGDRERRRGEGRGDFCADHFLTAFATPRFRYYPLMHVTK